MKYEKKKIKKRIDFNRKTTIAQFHTETTVLYSYRRYRLTDRTTLANQFFWYNVLTTNNEFSTMSAHKKRYIYIVLIDLKKKKNQKPIASHILLTHSF